jgi:hypothetical protein
MKQAEGTEIVLLIIGAWILRRPKLPLPVDRRGNCARHSTARRLAGRFRHRDPPKFLAPCALHHSKRLLATRFVAPVNDDVSVHPLPQGRTVAGIAGSVAALGAKTFYEQQDRARH